MKQRIISALIGLLLLAVVVVFYDSILLNIVVSIINIIAVLELLKATKTLQYKGLAAVAMAFTVLVCFAQDQQIRPNMPIFVFVLVVCFLLLVLKNYQTVRFEQAAMMLTFGLVVPVLFSCMVYMRNQFESLQGLTLLFLALGSAWFCDTGAYFTGVFFGKHKMAPNISPKKTVEGAIGGLISAVVLNLVLVWIMQTISVSAGTPIQINYLVVGLASPVLAAMGMVGDLVASVIKRQYGVKDYGNIMPGHGGVMDRFDSAMLTLPSVYILAMTFPVFLPIS